MKLDKIGALIGKLDVIPGNKFVVGAIGLVATSALHMTGLIVNETLLMGNDQIADELGRIADYGYTGFGGLAGVGLAFKAIRADAATRVAPILLALLVPLSLFVSGCATTHTGERKVDRQKCLQACAVAEAASPALCAMLLEGDAEGIAKCEAGAATATVSCKLGCQFADDVPPTVTP